MKVALIVQRFGEDIIGGAESHAFQVAKQLSESLGWTVHIYTTTAFSYQTWSHFYPEGKELIHNLEVYRFRSRIQRWPKVFKLYNRLFAPLLVYWGKHPQRIPRLFNPFLRLLETLWFILQGPWCPSLVEALAHKKNDYDQFIFFTYLYYPTVFGFPVVQEKAVLVPLAHTESPLSFPRVRSLLKMSKRLLANSEVEKELIIQKGLSSPSQVDVVGCGLDDVYFKTKISEVPHIQIPGLKAPYVTYLGRISKGKGVSRLIQFFLQFILTTKNEHLTLVLAGENDGSVNIFYHPQIKFIGYISQKDKTALIAHSSCVINPSPKESLSLLVLEAIALRKPVLVNSRCAVLKYYADHLETVFDFHNSIEFTEHLTRVLHLRKISEFKEDLKASKTWVRDRYSWETILSFYKSLDRQLGKEVHL